MRWFPRLDQVLKKAGLRKMQSGVCVFTRLDQHQLTEGILIAHVDDLLFTGTETFLNDVIRALNVFRTGELETLTRKSPIAFTGIQIELVRSGTILLSQEAYIRELPTMNINEFISGGKIMDRKKVRILFRQELGSLICAHQSRPDVGFAIARIATESPKSRESPEKARNIAALYNKTIKFLRNRPRKIHYAACPQLTSDREAIKDLMSRRIVAFSDAGFGSLTEGHSI